MSDIELKYEVIINDLGLTAPRITPAMIDELLDKVTYSTHVVPGTTTTLATAVAPSGFTLRTADSACASPANFNPALGIEMAITKAKAMARTKLWELEGYRLSQALHEVRQSSATQALDQIKAVLAARRRSAAPDLGRTMAVRHGENFGSSPAPYPFTGRNTAAFARV